jgi:ankyrin repeat protein
LFYISAVQYGYYDRVVELIESQPNLAVTPLDANITLLHWAAINNRIEIAKYLINKRAQIDAFGGELNSTPLHWAIRDGKLPMVVFLLSQQAQPSLFDGEGKSILKEFSFEIIFL